MCRGVLSGVRSGVFLALAVLFVEVCVCVCVFEAASGFVLAASQGSSTKVLLVCLILVNSFKQKYPSS